MSSRDKMFAGTDDKIALKRIMLEKLDDHFKIPSFQYSKIIKKIIRHKYSNFRFYPILKGQKEEEN